MDCNHVLDKLKSYGAAKKEIMPGVEHRQHKRLNNQLTPANKATGTADEAVQVGPPRSTLRLDPLANLFHLRRDHVTASQYRAARAQAFEDWAKIAGARLAA